MELDLCFRCPFILRRSRHLTHSVNLCDTFLLHAVFFVQNHLRTKTSVSLLRPFCVTLFHYMLYFSFGKFSVGMIFVTRVGITTTVVRRPHGFLFLMRKNDVFSPLQRNSNKCLEYYFFRFDTCEVKTKLLRFGSMSSIRSHTVPLCTVDKIESRGLLTVNTRATSL